jgi:SAM-dependent methyltransferase
MASRLSRPLRQYLAHLLTGVLRLSKKDVLGLLDERPGAVVLDVGCNDGAFTREIATKVNTDRIFGLEIIKGCAEVAQQSYGVNVVTADANAPFPFKDDSFDVVVSNDVLEHLTSTDNLVKEAYRVLRSGGYCVSSTPNLAGIHNIASLMLGYQPPTATVSDVFACGNPFNPDNGKAYTPRPGLAHNRIFTAPALKALFEFHGFDCQSVVGTGMHPLPLFMSRHVKVARYAAIITVKAFKR